MKEMMPHRNQSREQARGWAFCSSLLFHAGVVFALGFYLNTPLPAPSLTKVIKVELISISEAPKALKIPIPPPVVRKPVLVPPVQKVQPIIQKKFKPAPTPKPVAILKPQILPQKTETPKTVFERSIRAETNQAPKEVLLAPEAEESPVASVAEAEISTGQVPVTSGQNNELQNYSNSIREGINKAKRYPLMARRAGRQGTVVVEFKVDRQGELIESHIVDSCGTRALDKAALRALHRASPFARLPDSLKSPHTFNLQINFFLEG